MRVEASFAVAGALVLVLGCGGEATDGGTGSGAFGGSSGNGASSGSGGASGGGGSGGSGWACPDSPPADGSSCTPPAPDSSLFAQTAHCSWGDDPRPSCRTSALCEQTGRWTVTEPDAATCSTPPLPAACPNPPPSAGSQCTDETLACWYDDGARCWCSPCVGGSEYPLCQPLDPPEWACATPPTDCPATMPQAGTPCSVPGASCGPNCDLEIVCEDGVWKWRRGNCPVCAAPTTPIATPDGERPIAELRAGDLVYSVEGRAVTIVPLLRVASTKVGQHQVVRLMLDSGRVLEISPGHPTADGRRFGDLASGDRLDETHDVSTSALVAYHHDRTYDILPDSSSGTYFAAGALIGSTLRGQTDR